MGLKFSGRIGRGRLGAGIGAVLLASTAMTGVSLLRSTPAGAQSAQTSYSIPGGSLNRVLAEFGRQSGLQIVYVPAIADILNRNTGAVTNTILKRYEDKGIFTPYLGLVYDLSERWSAYASFAEPYKPQASMFKGPPPGTPLGPVSGRTYEVGVKGSLLDGRLNTSLALYHIKRNGQAMRDTSYPPTPGNLGTDCCYFDSGRVVSQGVDVEINGEIVDGWRVQAGYTFNDNQNQAEVAPTARSRQNTCSNYGQPTRFQANLKVLKSAAA